MQNTHWFKNPAFKRLGGEAFWVAFGMVLSTLAGFVGVRLLTGMLIPEEYGQLGLAMSVSMALQYSLAIAVNTSSARFYTVAREKKIFKWYWALLVKTGWQVFFASLVCSLFLYIVLSIYGNQSAQVYSLSIILGGLIVISGIGTGIQLGFRDQRAVCWNQNLFNWGRFAFAVLVLLFFSKTAVCALVGFLLAGFLMLGSQYLFVRKELFPLIRQEKGIKEKLDSDFYSYLFPLILSGIFVWVQLFSVRWVLHWFGSLADVGAYFAYHQIGFMMMLSGGTFLMRFLVPIFFDHSGDGSCQNSNRKVCVVNGWVSVCMLIIVLIIFFVVLIFTPFLANILVSPAYRDAAWMLPWLVLSGGLYAVARQLLVSLYSGVESWKMITVSFWGGGLALVLNIAGGWFLGMPGVIFSGVCFSGIYVALAGCLHYRELTLRPVQL